MKKPLIYTTDFFAPESLSELNACIASCSSCSLSGVCIDTTNAGSLRSGIILVGEALGAREVELRRPFAGPAGIELDKLLLRAGLFRGDMYTTNVVRSRPIADGKNRAPKASEVNACLPHLLNEIIILDPRVVVCLGGTAVNALMNPKGKSIPITRERGTLTRINGRIHVATFHPSYVMRSKRLGNMGPTKDVIADLQTAKRAAEEQRLILKSGNNTMSPWNKPGFMGTCFCEHAAYLKSEEDYIERAICKGTSVVLDGTEFDRDDVAIIENLKDSKFYILLKKTPGCQRK